MPSLVFLLPLLPLLAVLSAASDVVIPACALSCPTFLAAQSACSAASDACLCESALLEPLRSGIEVCETCTGGLLQAWYSAACRNVAATTVKQIVTRSNTGAGWFRSHYRWVIMLIVLVVGFGVIAVVGVWLKRRHDARNPHLYHGPSKKASSAGLTGSSTNNNNNPNNALNMDPNADGSKTSATLVPLATREKGPALRGGSTSGTSGTLAVPGSVARAGSSGAGSSIHTSYPSTISMTPPPPWSAPHLRGGYDQPNPSLSNQNLPVNHPEYAVAGSSRSELAPRASEVSFQSTGYRSAGRRA
ncbi:hypothetical protein ASPZODRAFT_26486 [Penicilliopsis zonata CBS 506.65]|uniref:Extracellular membrane protein CFEM domain-containing protein n=1 Tax=Penicilliopsis zonata CBS 506.65 TaxID=1073090 RepID=A0A1L9SFF3_9EURO|nr:hypothetical protein ASPZODRAFT_26486 [Penicilliopsis zonata CBS 506.65]OJJ45882.1 hypothetical protein ASPZODRAFT_26486 [Penicilliopsis zonata CBS 506.65]